MSSKVIHEIPLLCNFHLKQPKLFWIYLCRFITQLWTVYIYINNRKLKSFCLIYLLICGNTISYYFVIATLAFVFGTGGES